MGGLRLHRCLILQEIPGMRPSKTSAGAERVRKLDTRRAARRLVLCLRPRRSEHAFLFFLFLLVSQTNEGKKPTLCADFIFIECEGRFRDVFVFEGGIFRSRPRLCVLVRCAPKGKTLLRGGLKVRYHYFYTRSVAKLECLGKSTKWKYESTKSLYSECEVSASVTCGLLQDVATLASLHPDGCLRG